MLMQKILYLHVSVANTGLVLFAEAGEFMLAMTQSHMNTKVQVKTMRNPSNKKESCPHLRYLKVTIIVSKSNLTLDVKFDKLTKFLHLYIAGTKLNT